MAIRSLRQKRIVYRFPYMVPLLMVLLGLFTLDGCSSAGAVLPLRPSCFDIETPQGITVATPSKVIVRYTPQACINEAALYDPATFHATLDGNDITEMFMHSSRDHEWVTVPYSFTVGQHELKVQISTGDNGLTLSRTRTFTVVDNVTCISGTVDARVCKCVTHEGGEPELRCCTAAADGIHIPVDVLRNGQLTGRVVTQEDYTEEGEKYCVDNLPLDPGAPAVFDLMVSDPTGWAEQADGGYGKPCYGAGTPIGSSVVPVGATCAEQSCLVASDMTVYCAQDAATYCRNGNSEPVASICGHEATLFCTAGFDLIPEVCQRVVMPVSDESPPRVRLGIGGLRDGEVWIRSGDPQGVASVLDGTEILTFVAIASDPESGVRNVGMEVALAAICIPPDQAAGVTTPYTLASETERIENPDAGNATDRLSAARILNYKLSLEDYRCNHPASVLSFSISISAFGVNGVGDVAKTPDSIAGVDFVRIRRSIGPIMHSDESFGDHGTEWVGLAEKMPAGCRFTRVGLRRLDKDGNSWDPVWIAGSLGNSEFGEAFDISVGGNIVQSTGGKITRKEFIGTNNPLVEVWWWYDWQEDYVSYQVNYEIAQPGTVEDCWPQ